MKSFLVLGLGRFGRSVATTLASLGHEVLGVDGDERIVKEVARHLTEALQADITSEEFLKSLDIPHFDAVIVAVGDSMQVSIMVTVLLKELNARRIIAKAQDDFQEKVLVKLGADLVVLPERDLGIKTAHGLVAESLLETVELSADHSIVSVTIPEPWIGKSLGELALMTNGERWLPASRVCDVTVIPCKNYTHQTKYRLPIPPSPNLPDMKSIYLYPSTCLFEATPVSLGRGTDKPFQVYGHPNMKGYSFSFTPGSIPGAKNPPQLDRLCYGVDLSGKTDEEIWEKGLDLSYLIDAYRNLNLDDHFFRSFFELLIGTDYVRKMIKEGKSADEIKLMWKDDVEKFREQRKPYLLYEDNGPLTP